MFGIMERRCAHFFHAGRKGDFFQPAFLETVCANFLKRIRKLDIFQVRTAAKHRAFDAPEPFRKTDFRKTAAVLERT